jgi:hypothetical protein
VTPNQADTTTVKNATYSSSNTTSSSTKDRKSTDSDSNNESKNPDEVINGTCTGFGEDAGTVEKLVSPSKEKAQYLVPSPTKSSGGNYTSDSGLSGPNAASGPSTPTSPILSSDCISIRSDSTGTSNRSFAFPV